MPGTGRNGAEFAALKHLDRLARKPARIGTGAVSGIEFNHFITGQRLFKGGARLGLVARLRIGDAEIDQHGRIMRIGRTGLFQRSERLFAAPGNERLHRRLLELGFVPGERVQVLRRVFFGRGPLAVRVGTSTFAMRRLESSLIEVVPA